MLGRAKHARQPRPGGQQQGVRAGTAAEVAADKDPPGNNEQREQEDHERYVFGHHHVHQLVGGHARTKEQEAWHDKAERPEQSDLGKMMLPEARQEQWEHSNGQEQADERQRPKEPKGGAVDTVPRRCQCRLG